ncbi:WxL domain-containing protein [Enterococcus sp. LJL90]
MKRSHKIAGAALLATVAAGAVLSAQTNAASSMTGSGTVEFTAGGTQTTNPTNRPPDDSTGPEIVEPSQNPDLGKQRIISVTDLDFDVHQALETETDYDAKVFTTTEVVSGNEISMPHFVRFQDVRTDVPVNNYLIQAQITSQFTNAGTAANVLTGSTIEFKDASLTTSYAEYANNIPTGALPTASSTVVRADAPVDVVRWAGDATNINAGFGTFEIMFGTKDSVTDGTYDAVTLHRQPGVTVRDGVYNAEITWTIADVN